MKIDMTERRRRIDVFYEECDKYSEEELKQKLDELQIDYDKGRKFNRVPGIVEKIKFQLHQLGVRVTSVEEGRSKYLYYKGVNPSLKVNYDASNKYLNRIIQSLARTLPGTSIRHKDYHELLNEHDIKDLWEWNHTRMMLTYWSTIEKIVHAQLMNKMKDDKSKRWNLLRLPWQK